MFAVVAGHTVAIYLATVALNGLCAKARVQVVARASARRRPQRDPPPLNRLSR
jgi:hypothetical protein